MIPPSAPLEFVGQVSGSGHVVLLYEDPAYAERIEFRFLSDGLEKGESCLITTHGSTEPLMQRMDQVGMAPRKYIESGKLHVLNIPDPMAIPERADSTVREIYGEIFTRVTQPFRIVSTTFKDVSTQVVYDREMKLERTAEHAFEGEDEKTRHDVFRDKDGLVMCTYDVSRFGDQNKVWFKDLVTSHQAAIFAPKNGIGIGMDIRLAGPQASPSTG